MTAVSAWPANPYVGPRSFRPGEQLFGRDDETRRLAGLLVAERVVLLHSPSGAGKTSLIQAALVPRLRARAFHVRPVMRVGAEPLVPAANRYLLSALLTLEEGLPEGERLPVGGLAGLSLAGYLAGHPPPEEAGGDVLIFDQFEEVLTADPTDLAAKRQFFEVVGEALHDRNRWALFAMREDYIAGLEPFLLPIPTRLRTTCRLDLLGLAAAQVAIRGPALTSGVDFAEEAAERLAADLSRVTFQTRGGAEQRHGPTVEPVQLQVVCYRLWERLAAREPAAPLMIGVADLTDAGDVDQALSAYFDEQVARAAVAGVMPEHTLRLWFDRRLITPQGIRAQVMGGDSVSQGIPDAALRPLVDAYLVRAERLRGATWLELAHDRLVAPVRASNGAWLAAHLSTFQRQADLWDQQGRPPGLLLRDEALAEGEAWAVLHNGELTPAESDFLRLCRDARAALERERRQARRIRRLAVGAAVVGVVALAALVVALLLYGQSEQRRRLAVARRWRACRRPRAERLARRSGCGGDPRGGRASRP